MEILHLSKLRKTWFIDIDGTILLHNNDLENILDEVIPSSLEFLKTISDDIIILTTSRPKKFKDKTENFLGLHNVKYDQIIYDLPYGERILINDNKKSGLITAYSVSLQRDSGIILDVELTDI
jgi:hypothetical protein